MLLTNVNRWGGLTAMVGGVLFAALFAVGVLVESKIIGGVFFESHWGYHSLDAPVNVLLAASVLGLYRWQKDDVGRLGTGGFYLAFGGFALTALGGLAIMGIELAVGEGVTPGWLDSVTHMLAMLLSIVGSVIFGAATFRAKVLPRGGALLFVVGPLLFLGIIFGGVEGWPIMLPAVLFGGAWVWLGYTLRSEVYEPANQTVRVGA